MTIIDKVYAIANNVLYFDDNSDYSSALWEILEAIKPELFKERTWPILDYIEGAE